MKYLLYEIKTKWKSNDVENDLTQKKNNKKLEIFDDDVNLVKIQEAETILKETEKSKNITVGKLNVINKQIRNRQSLISNLRSDIKVQSDEIILIRNCYC